LFSDGPVGHCRGCIKNTERVGQNDGSFDLAEFVDLRGTDEFAEGVVGEHGAGDFVLKEIAGMRADGGNAGADVVALHQSDLADEDTGDVRDGVFRAGLVEAEGKAEIACSWSGFYLLGGAGLLRRYWDGEECGCK